jgi:hypothetical protein
MKNLESEEIERFVAVIEKEKEQEAERRRKQPASSSRS